MIDTKPGLQKELFSIREVGEMTGKCDRTLRRAVRAGKIQKVQLGASVMIPRREFQRILRHGL